MQIFQQNPQFWPLLGRAAALVAKSWKININFVPAPVFVAVALALLGLFATAIGLWFLAPLFWILAAGVGVLAWTRGAIFLPLESAPTVPLLLENLPNPAQSGGRALYFCGDLEFFDGSARRHFYLMPALLKRENGVLVFEANIAVQSSFFGAKVGEKSGNWLCAPQWKTCEIASGIFLGETANHAALELRFADLNGKKGRAVVVFEDASTRDATRKRLENERQNLGKNGS